MNSPKNRLDWMNNLRTFTVFLVVLYHVGGVYEAAGLWGWFWIVDDPATIPWVGILGIVFDILVMPLLFFIAGYFAPGSLDSRGGRAFLLGKAKRLLLPWAVSVLTLIPLYKILFLYSRGLPQEPWTTYSYVTHPNSQNWLWFLPVLFLFHALSLLLSPLKDRMSRIPWKGALAAGMLLSVGFSMAAGRFLGFRSWTLHPVINVENERFLLYFLSYLWGGLCFRQQVFAGLPEKKRLYLVTSCTAWIPVTGHIFVRLIPFLDPGGFAVTPLYRMAWWLTFHLALLPMLYLMIETFRRYFPRTGPVRTALGRNSFGVYILHVVVIGLWGTLFLPLPIPGWGKYLLMIPAVFLTSNGIVFLWGRLRGWRPGVLHS